MYEWSVDHASHPDPRPHVDSLDERLVEMTRTVVKNAEDISRRVRQAHWQSASRDRGDGDLFDQWFQQWDRSAGT